MSYVIRKCDNPECGKEYKADTRNLNRGWGLCCSKSCAASVREKSKPGYNPERVKRNNVRREEWNKPLLDDENEYGKYTGRRTSEGYKIYGDNGNYTAVDEFGDAVYSLDAIGEYDSGDSEYWDGKDFSL